LGFTKRFGFIGAGNLASAIVKGLLAQGNIKPENLYIYDLLPEKTQYLSETGVLSAPTAARLTELCDYIFLTVKPDTYKAVLEEIAAFVGDKCLIDVAAGITTDYVKSVLGFDAKVVRVMPNTPLLVGKGASALVHKAPVTDEEFQTVFDVFRSAGYAAKVEEEHINAVTAISGSAPAYFFRLASLAAQFAKSQGMDAQTALELFAKTMEGSAKMLLESGDAPEVLVKKVSSPGGTTVAALAKFDALGLDEAFTQGLLACSNRADELGKR
jgi:pyrroline-5-carboxylate reductase